MSNVDLSIIKENLSKKSTDQLIDLLNFSQDDYEPRAIEVIKEILTSRGVEQTVINDADNRFGKIVSKTSSNIKTQVRTTRTSKTLLYLLYFAGLLMLMYLIKIVRSSVVNNITSNSNKEVQLKKQVWTTGYKDSITTILNQSSLLTGMKTEYKKPFCDCFVDTLKQLYPNGITTTLSVGRKDTIVGDCAERVKVKLSVMK